MNNREVIIVGLKKEKIYKIVYMEMVDVPFSKVNEN